MGYFIAFYYTIVYIIHNIIANITGFFITQLQVQVTTNYVLLLACIVLKFRRYVLGMI